MRVTIFRFLLHSAMYFSFRFALSVLIVSCTLALCTQNNNSQSLKNNKPQLLAFRYTHSITYANSLARSLAHSIFLSIFTLRSRPHVCIVCSLFFIQLVQQR